MVLEASAALALVSLVLSARGVRAVPPMLTIIRAGATGRLLALATGRVLALAAATDHRHSDSVAHQVAVVLPP